MNRKGERLTKEWLELVNQRKRATEQLERINGDLEKATAALAKWGLPRLSRQNDNFCFWVGLDEHTERLLIIRRYDARGAYVQLDDRTGPIAAAIASATCKEVEPHDPL